MSRKNLPLTRDQAFALVVAYDELESYWERLRREGVPVPRPQPWKKVLSAKIKRVIELGGCP